MEPTLITFDPKKEELNAIAEQARTVTITDFDDKAQYALLKDTQLELKKLRVRIEKAGKEKREEANAFNKAVIKLEKEYISIVEPEERRLEDLRLQADEYQTRKQRLEDLPSKKAKIAECGFEIPDTDDFLLTLDDISFIGYLNERKAIKLADDQTALMHAQKELADKEAKIQAEKDNADAVERAREEERRLAQEKEQRLAREALIAKERAETEKKEAEERHARELVEAAEKAKADAEQAEKDRIAREENERQVEEAKRKQAESEEKFQAWLAQFTFDKETMKIEHFGNKVVLWKIVDTYYNN